MIPTVKGLLLRSPFPTLLVGFHHYYGRPKGFEHGSRLQTYEKILKKLKNKKEIFEVNDKKDILLNFMPKISTLLQQAWEGEWYLYA